MRREFYNCSLSSREAVRIELPPYRVYYFKNFADKGVEICFKSKRQSRGRLDRHGTIVVGSFATSHHYNAFRGVQQMTSNELKHEAKKQEWNIAIQERRGSGLSVSEWCQKRSVTTTTLGKFRRSSSFFLRKPGSSRVKKPLKCCAAD